MPLHFAHELVRENAKRAQRSVRVTQPSAERVGPALAWLATLRTADSSRGVAN